MNEAATWQRPKTTRRYIHPPKAERMFTLWAEGKVIFGQIEKNIDYRSYKHLECSGLWLVHGEDEQLDFHTVENVLPENGIPVHGIVNTVGNIKAELETFCDTVRKSTCFVKLTFTNTGAETISHPFALMLRSGKEQKLVFGGPDEYASYAPDVQVWKDSLITWRQPETNNPKLLVDEDVFLLTQTQIPVRWDEAAGALRLEISLEPGQSVDAVFAFGKGEAQPFCYEQEKALCVAFWERELSRINKLPKSIQEDPEKLKTIQHLTVHILQCFCYQLGENNLISRQGGLQRLIWPGEALYSLEALGAIGDFADYLEPVLSYYFDGLQKPNGQVSPLGEGWASITACALYNFAKYTLQCSRRFYYRYREHALAAFQWIKQTRATTANMAGCIPGLFPPMRGCDWEQIFQAWKGTDLTNVLGLEALCETMDRFGDPMAREVRAEYDDYVQVMRSVLAKFEKQAEGTDRLHIPISPDGNDQKLLEECYPNFAHGYFILARIAKDEDTWRVHNDVQALGIYGNDLYGHMPYEDGNTHIWYTNTADYAWFMAWMRVGQRERAEKTLNAQFRYSMTDEYYMIERYADNDPYYVPWSPNASANGRTILMLLMLA